MENIKEDINIKIDTDNKDNLIEVSAVLQTGMIGTASYITDIIRGELDAVLIECDKPLQLYITLADFGDKVLFDSYDKQVIGAHYFPLKTQDIDESWQGWTQSSSKWILNNKIRVEIAGALEANANVIIRYRRI